jgi:adenosylhomocysteine nucleosidase
MKNILVVSAIPAEFPFSKELNILYTGAGKLNASISLLSYLDSHSQINTVINVGTAGGVDVNKHAVIECGTFIQGDLDYPGYELETIVTDSNKYTLSTFDMFQTTTPKRQCNCIDMEGFAFAKICKIKKLKFLCYKYISDIVGETNQESKWLENYQSGRVLLKEKVISNL